MDVGCRVRWFSASTMTFQHYSFLTIPSKFQKSTSTCKDISVRGHPYPQLQQIKVPKQIIHIIATAMACVSPINFQEFSTKVTSNLSMVVLLVLPILSLASKGEVK